MLSPLPNPSFTTLTVDPPTLPGTVGTSQIFSTSATATGKVKRPANADPAFNVVPATSNTSPTPSSEETSTRPQTSGLRRRDPGPPANRTRITPPNGERVGAHL